MCFHLRLAGEDGVLVLLLAPGRSDGVKVLVQLLELQLALGDLVEGDAEQAVLVDLPDVVEPWVGRHTEGSAPTVCMDFWGIYIYFTYSM